MAYKRFYSLFMSIVWCYFISLSIGYAMQPVVYTLPTGVPSWQLQGNLIRCDLFLTIPNYGVAHFEQQATQKPHFILQKWDQVTRSLPAKITIKPPSWKPEIPSFLAGKFSINPGTYNIFFTRDATLKLLAYLYQGYEPTFDYLSDLGFNVQVALTPIGFQKQYGRYQKCISKLLPFNYDQIKESVFTYSIEDRELTDEYKAQLRRIAKYVEADPQIKMIKIAGHTDETGRKGYNNAISQYRAQTVQDYLLDLGVPEDMLSVTWFGELKPIARNDTETGRASNRRVIIRVIKK